MVEILAPQLMAALRTVLQEEVALQKNVRGSTMELRDTLEVLRNKVHGVRKEKIRDLDTRYWIQQLEDIIYDADDLFDECQYRIAEIDRLSVPPSPAPGAQPWCDGRLLLTFVTQPYQYFFRKIISNHSISIKLRGLNSRLQMLKDRKSKLDLNINGSEAHATAAGSSKEVYNGDGTPAAAAQTDLVGKKLQSDASFLLTMFTNKSKLDENENLLVYAIVGPGGIGKTTLANLIFNGDDAGELEYNKIWVTVSRKFDKVDILKRITVSLTADAGMWRSGGDLKLLEKDVRDTVKGKKLFLVLDDVWDAMELWCFWLGVLIRSSCSPGSRVVVTTRSRDVADQMLAVYSHPVQPLTEEEGWKLLCRCVGSSARETRQIMEDLQPTGLKIVRRCYGNPMAIISMGGMLSLEKRKEAWELFLKKNIWSDSLLDLPAGIQRYLYNAFDDLPSYELKQCFVYCSLFPDGHEIPCSDLVELWVAEGFAKDEEEAMRWFMLLIRRNILVPWLESDFTRMCKIDGLSSSLGRHLMQGSGLVVDKAELLPAQAPATIASKTTLRRLSLVNGDAKDHDFLNMQASVRTLLLFKHHQRIPLYKDKLLDKLPCIRVLSFREAQIDEVPDSLGSLLHLRYLDLSGNKEMTKLPESIGKLSNLQVLRVRECEKLAELPKSFLNLQELKYLDAEKTALEGLPLGIGKNMTQLRRITPFRLHHGDMATVKDLKPLVDLRTLSIEIVDDTVGKSEAITAELKNKTRLRELTLAWEGNEAAGDREVVDELCPSPSVEDLRILHYPGRSLPTWLGLLPNLTTLYLGGCNEFTEMPSALCRLPNLEHLEFTGASAVTRIRPEFFGDGGVGFPKLKVLIFDGMAKWESWEMKQGSGWAMPCLHTLGIYQCPNLKSLPEGLLEGLKFLRHLRIRNAEKLPLTAVENLRSLESLVVMGVNKKLESVSNLKGLRCLAVPDCRKLQVAADEKFDALEAARVDMTNKKLPDWLKELSKNTDEKKINSFINFHYF